MKNLLTFMAVFICHYSFSQTLPAPSKRCATFESLQEYRQLHPSAESDNQFETWIKKRTEDRLHSGRINAAYTVPVVFHVVHNGEAVGTGSNLSQARIQQQLAQLNADYANLSGSPYAVAANIEVQFCLAVISPTGTQLAEPGINRINRNTMAWAAPPYDGRPSNSYVDETIMPSTIWDPYQYFNIWSLDLGATLLGKATFPASSTLAGLANSESDNHAGVMIHYASVGSVSSPGAYGPTYGLGRTLAHEAGHFFGLRHIWGDGPCADDYCADTPPQNLETTGCPASGTLNGCTPSVAKMFQNYMDYTDDPCVNTFTADQKARIQTVMLNSPRRKELGTSTVCIAPPGNSVRLSMSSSLQSEAPNAGICPRYKEITVSLSVFTAATGNATVSFGMSGSATSSKDYTITPASVSFTNGDATPKVITIRIIDDGAVEPTETLVLNYIITGTGVIPATASQTFTLSITDDDLTPMINNAGTINMLNESFGTSGGTLPLGWTSGSFRSPAGTNVWVVGSNGGTGITGQSAYITSNVSSKPLTYSGTSISDAYLITPAVSSTGLINPTLSFTYKCLGETDASGYHDFGAVLYSLDGSFFDFLRDDAGVPYLLYGRSAATNITIPLPSYLLNTNFKLGFRWINDNTLANNPSFLVDNVLLTATTRMVESDLASSGILNIFSAQDVYITSEDEQVMARINNASADLGCVTASLIGSGNGTASINTSRGSYMRTQKVIQISPSVPNSTATYQATLYFSTAELSIWGASRTSLKILKVNDGVALNSVISSTNAQVITPISVVEYPAEGYIAYTANFTGFSQFMLVSPTILLPVEFISFEAKPASKEIVLNWKTAAESKNKGFYVERSINGTDFTSLGWVAGQGNTDRVSSYAFTDRFVQPNTVYYYRLKQEDIDNRQSHSMVRQAKIEEHQLVLTLSPNPAKDKARVFLSGTTAPVDITLLNAKGQEVSKWQQVNASTSPFTIDISGLAKGYYTIMVRHEQGLKTAKLVVQ
jgi:hypothetical protein